MTEKDGNAPNVSHEGGGRVQNPELVRCPANMAQIRQSRPDSGLDFQVEVLKTFCVVPSWPGSGTENAPSVNDKGGGRAGGPELRRLRWNNLKRFNDFCRKAKARTWP